MHKTANIYGMYSKNDLDDFKQEFEKIGISNEADMIEILNGFDSIAEVGYLVYKKQKLIDNAA